MAAASIPVDLNNPGQVFACLGFLEASDFLHDSVEGRFDWNKDEVDGASFFIKTRSSENPFASVLEFLAHAKARAILPHGWWPKKDPRKKGPNESPKDCQKRVRDLEKLEEWLKRQHESDYFPNEWPDTHTSMPVRLSDGNGKSFILNHWADGSTRNDLKLYAGNRSALDIATAMLGNSSAATREETKGIAQLWQKHRDNLIEHPFHVTTPMKGSFNFDPRGAWTAIDAGYSPDAQKHKVVASPVVEILAALGLQNSRPKQHGRQVGYTIWAQALPLILAQAALGGGMVGLLTRQFVFELGVSGKNKFVTFSEEESGRNQNFV